ncbi:MAG: replication endonuclease [Comamonas sp.]
MNNNEQYFNLISNININNASNFEELVKLHEQAEACQVKQIEQNDPIKQSLQAYKDFIDLIPEVLQSYVLYVVKNEFKNDLGAYRSSVPMFENLFNREHCRLANRLIDKKKDDSHRKHNSERKELLLWACQLLKLIGSGRGGALPLALVNEYKESLEAQEAFINNHRLIGLNGKSYKLSKNKRKKRNAQNYRISKTFEQIAEDKKFTFSFITLTLPPEYHPNPKFGHCSYSGKTPSQAKAKINSYWELIRANLAKAGLKVGDDFFGLQVNEAHKDSTLHKHLMIYHSKKNISLIHQVIKNVEHRERQAIAKTQGISIKKVKFKFDIKLNNEKAKASSYLFKYISKSLDDKETLTVEACRSFYSTRAFNHFGLDGKINTFNHLCSNYKSYENILTHKLIDVFSSRDLYNFLIHHKDKFKSISSDGIFLGVAYEEQGNITLIEKRQYCLFECPDKNYITLNDVSAVINHSVAKARFSYCTLQSKAKHYSYLVNEYLTDKKSKGVNVLLKDGFSIPEQFHCLRDKELEELKNKFDSNFRDDFTNEYIKDYSNNTFEELVTVILHYSRENDLQPFSKPEIPPDGQEKQAEACLTK